MTSLHYFEAETEAANRLALLLDISSHSIKVHPFPDGESMVQITLGSSNAIIYASLDDPDTKLIQLAFAASALRDSGVKRIVLVAPYLCYMRQDKAFHAGEAISQRVIAAFLSSHFDRIVTVDPHLHRVHNLQDIFLGCQADSLIATGPISQVLKQEDHGSGVVLVGPDSEAEQWVKSIADEIKAPYVLGEKIRKGDRSVSIELPHCSGIKGAHAIIVDDVIASGGTIIQCVESLVEQEVTSIEVIATHILCSDDDLKRIEQAGVSQVRSTDSVEHETNIIQLAPLLADALAGEV